MLSGSKREQATRYKPAIVIYRPHGRKKEGDAQLS
jgi:hypothetical protein